MKILLVIIRDLKGSDDALISRISWLKPAEEMKISRSCIKEGSSTTEIFIPAAASLLSIWSRSAGVQGVVDSGDTGWRWLKMKQTGAITSLHLTRECLSIIVNGKVLGIKIYKCCIIGTVLTEAEKRWIKTSKYVQFSLWFLHPLRTCVSLLSTFQPCKKMLGVNFKKNPSSFKRRREKIWILH